MARGVRSWWWRVAPANEVGRSNICESWCNMHGSWQRAHEALRELRVVRADFLDRYEVLGALHHHRAHRVELGGHLGEEIGVVVRRVLVPLHLERGGLTQADGGGGCLREARGRVRSGRV